MRNVVEKLIYMVFTFVIFILLWKMTAKIWDAFVPFNYKTDLFGVFIVVPLMIGLSFVLSSLTFRFIKNANN